MRAKNEAKSYSTVSKRIWTEKYIREHHTYDKNNTGYVNVGSFSQ